MLRQPAIVLVSLLLLLPGCAGKKAASLTNSPADRDHDWSQVTLEGSDFDRNIMRNLDADLDAGVYDNIHVVMVEHKGRLVFEKYLAGEDWIWGEEDPVYREFDQRSLHDLRSISKSVTSLLLGIALGENFRAELQRPILDFFPELADQVAAGVEQVTLYQVLTMTAGLAWNEMSISYTSPLNDAWRMHFVDDPVHYALTKPLIYPPGDRWYYNSGMTLVLAAVIEKVSGQDFLEFALQALASPLDIAAAEVEWRGRGIWPDRATLPSASGGLRANARSLAKIGALLLDEGRWRGRQVVPREWIEISTRRHTEQSFSRWSMQGTYGYGFQWWHGRFSGDYGDFTAIAGVGYGGQRLFVVPARDLVVTLFAGNDRNGNYRASEKLLAAIIAALP